MSSLSSHKATISKSTGLLTLAPNAAHTATVIIMHGLGDTARGWADVAAMLAEQFSHIKFLLPTAETQPVTLNMGMSMPSWYDIKGLDDRVKETCDGIDKSRDRIRELVRAENDAGIPCSRIALGGFSQGGAMTYYTGLSHDEPFAGLFVMSGYVPLAGAWQPSDASRGVPLTIHHGTSDPVVKLAWATRSVEWANEHGLGGGSVEFVKYRGLQHGANPEEISNIAAFIAKCLPAEGTCDATREGCE